MTVALFTLVLALEAFPAATSASAPPPASVRGIVFILADDLRADHLGCTGRTGVRTPGIDRLAREGTLFSRAYCEGSRSPAVCLPSRSRLLSGCSDWTIPDWSKAHRDPDLPLWPAALRDLGWRTHHVGKWHAGRPWLERCHETGEAVLPGGMGSHWTLEVEDHGIDGSIDRRRITEYSTREFGVAARRFLEQHVEREPDRPFVLSLCFTAPHDPRTSPDEAEADRRAADVALPENLLPVHPFDNGEMIIRDETLLPWPRDETAIRREIALYEQMVETLDAEVQAVIETLHSLGLLDEVLVVFAGDHGLALGSHGLLGKQNLYEHSMRTPLILRGPGIPVGERRGDLVLLQDLAPTLLAIAGCEVPDSMDGRHLLRPSGREGVLTRYRDLQRAWTEDRWKVVWYPAIDRWQLFDLHGDPEETEDLAKDPAHAPLLRRMQERLQEARRAVNDDAPLAVEPGRSAIFDVDAANAAREAGPPHWTLR